MSLESDLGHPSVGMMQKLLPMLLYIRNYNEYKRHQHSVPSRNPRKNFSNSSAVKLLTVSKQISAYYEAEARLAAQRHSRAEARQIRMKELEKQQKEFEETSDRHYEMLGKSGRTGINSSATKTPVTASDNNNSSGSRRSSEESLDGFPFSDALEFRHQFNDLDDKYRKAMVTNAQLDNERQALTYQVDLYKDEIDEFEENFIRLQKDHKDKSRTYDQLNRDLKNLQRDHDLLKECLRQRDFLIEESGLVLMDSDEYNPLLHLECNQLIGINGDISDKRSESFGDDSGSESGIGGSATTSKTPSNVALVSREAAQLLADVEGHTLEAKIKTLLTERHLFMTEITQFKTDLEEQRQKSARLEELTLIQASHSSIDSKLDIQREANRLVSDYNYKLKQCEHEINVLNGTVDRLEAQVLRHRTAAEESERLEDELKTDRRKMQRELREWLARVEELETSNAHLQKRIDKLKSNRTVPNSN